MKKKYKLHELCDMRSGGTPSRKNLSFYGGNIPWAKISDIERANGLLLNTEEKITEDGLNDINNHLFSKGTLLFAMYGSVGKVAFSGINLAINQAILGITIKANQILYDRYLYYWFIYNKQKLLDSARGVALKNLSATLIKNLEISPPDVKFQNEIIKLLDKADAIRKKRREAIRLADEFLRSTFLEMFGDPVVNTKNWDIKKVDDIKANESNSIKAGPFGSSLKKEYYVENGYKIYGQEQVIRNDFNYGDYYINGEKYKKLENCKIKTGDILISLVGTFGEISIVPKKIAPGIINPRLMKITLDQNKILPIFFKTLLKSEGIRIKIKNLSHGGTMNIINVGIMKELRVPVPDIELQRKFAKIVEKTEKLKQKYEQSLQEAENLFNSLMQRAFRGEV